MREECEECKVASGKVDSSFHWPFDKEEKRWTCSLDHWFVPQAANWREKFHLSLGALINWPLIAREEAGAPHAPRDLRDDATRDHWKSSRSNGADGAGVTRARGWDQARGKKNERETERERERVASGFASRHEKQNASEIEWASEWKAKVNKWASNETGKRKGQWVVTSLTIRVCSLFFFVLFICSGRKRETRRKKKKKKKKDRERERGRERESKWGQ